MYFKGVVTIALVYFSGCSFAYILDKNVTMTDCKSICASSEDQVKISEETKICKCPISKILDDVEKALIDKNAKLISSSINHSNLLKSEGVITKRGTSDSEATEVSTSTLLQPISSTEKILGETASSALVDKNSKLTSSINYADLLKLEGMVIKRGTSDSEATELREGAPDPSTSDSSPNEEKEADLNPEGIVGQAPPFHRRVHQRPVTPRRQREPRPITSEQQRIIMQQIHDHLTRLSQMSDQRIRDIEIEAIKSNLRQLSHTVVSQTPQIRTRMRIAADENRRRPHRPRLVHSRIVGAGTPQNSSEIFEEMDVAVKEASQDKKQHHFEIITQDPSLIDE